MLQFRHKLSPYLAKVLKGRVHMTVLRGQPIYSNGTFTSEIPRGILLTDPLNWHPTAKFCVCCFFFVSLFFGGFVQMATHSYLGSKALHTTKLVIWIAYVAMYLLSIALYS